MINFKNYIKDFEWCFTGSYGFKLSNCYPKDIDICVCIEDEENDVEKLENCIAKYIEDNRITNEIKIALDYEIPFEWGGTTYERIQTNGYDIFAVDRDTYKTIEITTVLISQMPLALKEMLSRDKEFRVSMFQLIAKRIFKERGNDNAVS